MAEKKPAAANPTFDLASGHFQLSWECLVAVGGIIGGLVMEGGKVSDVTQITAAIIVLGGTLGAVMITSPLPR